MLYCVQRGGIIPQIFQKLKRVCSNFRNCLVIAHPQSLRERGGNRFSSAPYGRLAYPGSVSAGRLGQRLDRHQPLGSFKHFGLQFARREFTQFRLECSQHLDRKLQG